MRFEEKDEYVKMKINSKIKKKIETFNNNEFCLL